MVIRTAIPFIIHNFRHRIMSGLSNFDESYVVDGPQLSWSMIVQTYLLQLWQPWCVGDCEIKVGGYLERRDRICFTSLQFWTSPPVRIAHCTSPQVHCTRTLIPLHAWHNWHMSKQANAIQYTYSLLEELLSAFLVHLHPPDAPGYANVPQLSTVGWGTWPDRYASAS